MFSSFTNALFGDGRAAPAIAAFVALVVIAGLGYWVYRLAFATRLRPSGGARGRAPRLGVVDVFGLDGQRQLVIVRRDNIEHLLLLGGPNDLVVEPNILRNANGRDASKSAGAADGAPETPAPIPAPAAVPPRAAMARRDPPRAAAEELAAPAEPEILAPPARARAAPPPRASFETPLADASRSEPAKPFMPVEPSRPYTPAERPKPVVTPEPPPAVTTPEPSRPVGVFEPIKPAEPPPSVKPVDSAIVNDSVGRVAVDTPRKALPPAPPRPVSATARPSLPPPIMPLRVRGASEMSPEPVRAAPAPLMVAEPAKPAVAALPDLRPLPPPEPPIAIKPAQEIVPKSAPAITPDHEAPTAPKPKKDEAFYDLESLEAEMARLLGRDP